VKTVVLDASSKFDESTKGDTNVTALVLYEIMRQGW